mgnify:CR=1 FL=1|jgi:hypothetical protein
MWDKLERKFGRFAIPRLMNYMIGGYIIGYLLHFGRYITGVDFLAYLTLDPYQIIHATNGFPIPQFWRLISWLLVPPDQNHLILGVIMMIFYWQLGTVLERTWGVFRFNVYMFGGIIFTIIGAFILFALTGGDIASSYAMSYAFTTNYINLSIFLAFALCYPDMQIMLYFIIPIKMKWLALVYAAFIVVNLATGGVGDRIVIVSSLLNFAIYYLSTRDYYRIAPKERKRKAAFKRAYDNMGKSGSSGPIPKHKCCICGRTDKTNPELEFRFCSKCNGNYEYCQDHLFTHVHKS